MSYCSCKLMFARAEVVFTIIWQGVLLCILFFLLGYMYPENGDTRGFSCCKFMLFFKDTGWWCYAAAAMSQFSVEVDISLHAGSWGWFSPQSPAAMADDGSSSSSETITYEEHCQNQGYPLSLVRGATSMPEGAGKCPFFNSHDLFG